MHRSQTPEDTCNISNLSILGRKFIQREAELIIRVISIWVLQLRFAGKSLKHRWKKSEHKSAKVALFTDLPIKIYAQLAAINVNKIMIRSINCIAK